MTTDSRTQPIDVQTAVPNPHGQAPASPPHRRPWTDNTGRVDRLKATVFVLMFVPALIIAWRFLTDDLGPRSLHEMILITGLWTIRLLLLSLLVTPIRQSWHWPRLVTARRQIGVAAMSYALAHLMLYVVDQQFDLAKVASEIWLRIYLTIGFTGVVILTLLGVTSTNGMIKRLGGKRWRRLHQLAYIAMLLATVHFFMQSKINVTQATWMAGIFLWAMLYRLEQRLGPERRLPNAQTLALITLSASLLTAVGEALYFEFLTRIPGWRLFTANINPGLFPRPAATVLAIGLALTLGALVFKSKKRRRP